MFVRFAKLHTHIIVQNQMTEYSASLLQHLDETQLINILTSNLIDSIYLLILSFDQRPEMLHYLRIHYVLTICFVHHRRVFQQMQNRQNQLIVELFLQQCDDQRQRFIIEDIRMLVDQLFPCKECFFGNLYSEEFVDFVSISCFSE